MSHSFRLLVCRSVQILTFALFISNGMTPLGYSLHASKKYASGTKQKCVSNKNAQILIAKIHTQWTVWKIWANQCQTAWTDVHNAPSGNGRVVIHSNIC